MKTNSQGVVSRSFSVFKKGLAVLYFIGFVLHGLDLLDLRLSFSSMDGFWKTWILSLFISDALAALGLYLEKWWGDLLFVAIALAQIGVYSFTSVFGPQTFLIYFHVGCLATYMAFKILNNKNVSKTLS